MTEYHKIQSASRGLSDEEVEGDDAPMTFGNDSEETLLPLDEEDVEGRREKNEEGFDNNE
ncbi:MAG: hypothetical protein NUV53_04685 [Patescibacteria group bacterium]|nr:hypothetical protein [Patescibacteria group bacterium]